MSQRREVETRLDLFDELSGILGAMRSFALVELRRVNKREAAQQQVMQSLMVALHDLADCLPKHDSSPQPNPNAAAEIWLLFGSVRGFCGSFNEDVLHGWRTTNTDQTARIILCGERLHDILNNRENMLCVAGADGSLDAAAAIDRILEAISTLRRDDNRPLSLWACFRDEQGPQSQQLWPVPQKQPSASGYAPLTLEPAVAVAAKISENYLFHSLLAILLHSIKVENHMRLMQMETALRHLQSGMEDLQRQKNRLRQEEIVEEIEIIVSNRHRSQTTLP